MKKHLCLVLVILMASQASAYIGVMPSQRNLGTVERGESYELDLYVTSDSSTPITLEPTAGRVPTSDLDGMEDANYFDIEEYSAEPVSSWIDFDSETYTIRPEGLSRSADGRTVNANVSHELDVPRGAEPGYHAVRIELNPQFDDGGGTSVRTVGLSSHSIYFRVPGEVERGIEIDNVEALRSGENTAIIRAEATNTGSVTTRLRPDEVSITGADRTGSAQFDNLYLAPGDSETIETTWGYMDERIRAGNYQVSGSLSYTTGQAFLQESVTITDFIQITPSQQNGSSNNVLPSGQGDSSLPIWLIVMFLVIVGSVMYAFEIDPLLIILSMAVIGISSVIFFSSLPAYYIAVVLLAAVGMFYYGWL